MDKTARIKWLYPVTIILAVSVLGAGIKFFAKMPAAPAPRPPTYRKDLPPNTLRLVATEDQTVAELLAQSNVDPFTVGWIESSGPVFYLGGPKGTYCRIHWNQKMVPAILSELSVRRGDEIAWMHIGNASPEIYRGDETNDLIFRLPAVKGLAETLEVSVDEVPPVKRMVLATLEWGSDYTRSTTQAIVSDASGWIRAVVEAKNGSEPWYEFDRIYVPAAEQIPATSTNRIIGAVVGGTSIHVRIFDSKGNRIYEADESKLRVEGKNHDIEALRAILMEPNQDSDAFDPYVAQHLIAALSGRSSLVWSASTRLDPGVVAELGRTPNRKWEKGGTRIQFFATPDNKIVTITRVSD